MQSNMRMYAWIRKNFLPATTWLILGGMIWAVANFMPARADGDSQLGEAFRISVRGDVVSAGVGLRRAGTGTLTMTEIPSGASVYRAYLYWATLGSSDDYTGITVNDTPVSGNVIGTAGDTCWGVEHNFVYRADVTELVADNGNGTYQIAGLPNLLRNGNDSQGASLVVIYTHPTARYREIMIHDGAVALDLDTHTYQDTFSAFMNDNPVTNAHVTYLVGDGQPDWNDGDVTFNGNVIASNVFNGSDGEAWGTLTFDVTSLVKNPSATTTINNFASSGQSPDCLLWAATVFSVTRPTPNYDEFIYLPMLAR